MWFGFGLGNVDMFFKKKREMKQQKSKYVAVDKKHYSDHFRTVLSCGRLPLSRTLIWDYGAGNLQHQEGGDEEPA